MCLLFLDFKLNVTKQKRTILSVDGMPFERAMPKDAISRQGSDAPQKRKTVKITGKH